MAGGVPIREPMIDRKTGRLTPVCKRYFLLSLTPILESITVGIVPGIKDITKTINENYTILLTDKVIWVDCS